MAGALWVGGGALSAEEMERILAAQGVPGATLARLRLDLRSYEKRAEGAGEVMIPPCP